MSAISPLIIYRPELQTKTQRTFFGVVTFGLWAFWLYLWLPLITAFLWTIGIHVAYVDILHRSRGVDLTPLTWILLLIIIGITCWSNYNRIRYAKSCQRRHTKVVSKASLGEAFGITEANTITSLRQERHLELRLSDSGQLLQVKPRAEVVSKASLGETFGITEENTVPWLTQQRHLELRFSGSGRLLQVKARTEETEDVNKTDVLEGTCV
jgi:poly-beta-1,6-N-acetyl-D-glucosamine biosynthesis protein PgaD